MPMTSVSAASDCTPRTECRQKLLSTLRSHALEFEGLCLWDMQVTTVDQKTLKSGKEPLHMLSTFRSLQHLRHKFPESKYPSKAIFFGNLCTAIGHGIIRVGDSVSRELRDGPME